MWELAVNSLRHQKFRLFSTGLAVILGVAFLSGSGILTDTIGGTFSDLIEETSAGVDVTVRSSDVIEAELMQIRARIPVETVETVREVQGVAGAAPYVEGFAQLVNTDGIAIGDPRNGVPTIGISWVEIDSLNQFGLIEGRAPESGEIVVDRTTAQDNGISLGDEITVLLQVPPEPFTVVGIGSFGKDNALLGATLTAFDLDTAQRVLGEPNMINQVLVAAEPGTDVDSLSASISTVLPADLEALTNAESVAEDQEEFNDLFSFFDTFMTAFALIALFVAGFIIYNTFSILVAQRKRETALLRALGARGRQVIGSLLIEAVMVGFIASIIGLIAGIGVASLLRSGLKAIGFDVPANSMVLDVNTFIQAFLAGMIITVVSAVIPALRAAKIAPMVALRRAAVDSSSLSLARSVFGAVMLVLGLVGLFVGLFGSVGNELTLVGLGAAAVFVGVAGLGPLIAGPFSALTGTPVAALRGLPGELARENSMRNPKRTATSAAALTVGVGLVCAISIFATSVTQSIDNVIDTTVVGDVIIDGQSRGAGGLSTDLVDRLNAAPEVDAASGARATVFTVDGKDSALNGFDTNLMGSLFDVQVVEGAINDLGEDGLAVLDSVAEERGWVIGTELDAHFVDGGDQNFTVRAIYSESTIAGTMFISNEAYTANVDGVYDSLIFVKRNPAVEPETFRAVVEDLSSDQANAIVQDQEELKDSISGEVDQALALVYGLLALAVIIALIGITNTISLSTAERTNEIGLLRALGTTRSQLRSAIRWEAFLTAALGSALGLGVGVFLGWATVRALEGQGIGVFAVNPMTLAVIVVIATLAGVLAAIRPAYRAARLPVLDAIQNH